MESERTCGPGASPTGDLSSNAVWREKKRAVLFLSMGPRKLAAGLSAHEAPGRGSPDRTLKGSIRKRSKGRQNLNVLEGA